MGEIYYKQMKHLKGRPEGGINHEKEPFAKEGKPLKNLLEIVEFVKPNALIGFKLNTTIKS